MTRRSRLQRIGLVIILLISGIALAWNTTISDTALDMLPDEAVRGDFELLQQLGMVDKVLISLTLEENNNITDRQAIEKLTGSVERLGAEFEASNLFKSLIYKLPVQKDISLFDLFHTYLPILLNEQDILSLKSKISDKAIWQAMSENFIRLNSFSGIGAQKQITRDPLDLTSLIHAKLKYLKSSFAMSFKEGYFLSEDSRSILLIGVAKHHLIDGKHAEQMQKVLDKGFKNILPAGIQPLVIGTLPHTLANKNSINHDLRTLVPLATFFLLALLVFGLRSYRALIVCVIPFLAAPSAIGITNLIHGKIGGLALGFGIVLIGIAVDFSIHLYLALRYGEDSHNSILRRIGKPILLAALTTTSVFIVLLFSHVPSHNQMATLALFGILLAVLLTYLIIPVIVVDKKQNIKPPSFFNRFNSSLPQSNATVVLAFWLLFILSGIFCWSTLQYQGDLQALDMKNDSILATEQQFKKTWKQQGEQGFLIAQGNNLQEALRRNSQIYSSLKQSGLSFQSIGGVLPSLATQAENFQKWHAFWEENYANLKNRFQIHAEKQGFAPHAFSPFFSWLKSDMKPLELPTLKKSPLGPVVHSMINDGKNQKQPDKPSYLVTTTVDTSAGLIPPLLELDSREGITLVSNSKWRIKIEKILKRDIFQLTLGAGVLIVFIVISIFRNTRKVLGVLAPVLSALSSMAIFSYINGAELNMMHLLMGIMVIGLSVDYGIFIVCSIRNRPSPISLAAVSICAASSLIGFGVLSFAQHPALQSLGQTVLIGIGAAWPTAIWITPCIVGFSLKRTNRQRAETI